MQFNLGEINITPAKTLKYLGITLSDKGSFSSHIKELSKKAGKRAATLGWLMTNIGGPKNERRRVLHGVIQSILQYGALIWYKDLKIASCRT